MAITAFNFAIKRAPYDTHLRLLVMKEYRQIGKEREALHVIDEAIHIDPSDPLLFNELRSFVLSTEAVFRGRKGFCNSTPTP